MPEAHLNGVVCAVLPGKALEAPPDVHDFQGHVTLLELVELEWTLGWGSRAIGCATEENIQVW